MKKLLSFIFITFLFFSGSNNQKPISVSKVITKKQSSVLFVFFDNADKHLQEYLVKEVCAFYDLQVIIDTSTRLPKSAYYKPRNRYRAEKLLNHLRNSKPVKYEKVVGFTNKDISTTKGKNPDHGIFGLAYRPGTSGVISSYRLKSDSIKCLYVVLHEIGHTYGVPHCSDPKCFMVSAKGKMVKVSTRDDIKLCDNCRKIIFRDNAQGR